MPRIARLVVPGYPHHITQRGNYRQNIFSDDTDRRRYLNLVADYSQKFRLKLLAYCLMDNHVHFIVMPDSEESIADTFHIVHTVYSQYFNKKNSVTGHLLQGRYYSCVLDERHLLAAARYVERNPVRVKTVKDPTGYIWSSARGHAAVSNHDIINTDSLFDYIEIKQNKWKDFINQSDDPDEVSVIRKCTASGRPLGNNIFVQKLEKISGQILHALPVGRPKKLSSKK